MSTNTTSEALRAMTDFSALSQPVKCGWQDSLCRTIVTINEQTRVRVETYSYDGILSSGAELERLTFDGCSSYEPPRWNRAAAFEQQPFHECYFRCAAAEAETIEEIHAEALEILAQILAGDWSVEPLVDID